MYVCVFIGVWIQLTRTVRTRSALTLQLQLNMCAPPCAHVFVYLAAAAVVAWDMAQDSKGRGRWEAAGSVGMGLHNWENVKAQPADAFELSFTAKHTKAKVGAVRHFRFGFMLLLHDVQRHIQWRWQLVAKSAKTLSTSRASQTICALSLLLSHVLVL